MSTRNQLAGIVTALACVTIAVAALQFPTLTGRVVDEAGILSPSFEAEITAQLAAHEQSTTNQVVVATLKSLQEYDIADYANQLFRHWGIGQKDKNNGVLLVIAPNERKMRIEVGYGLEGVLTDAISRDIIERHIKPAFRQQNFEQGIGSGVDAILIALGGEYQSAPPPVTASENPNWLFFLPILIFAIPVISIILIRVNLPQKIFRLVFASFPAIFLGSMVGFINESVWAGLVAGIIIFVFFLLPGSRNSSGSGGGSSSGWSSGSSSSSGGGFSGGGGSSGGGGASGSW